MPSELKNDILNSFHSQFAQNQNHHQDLFIKFVSAVLIVTAGYIIVFANTSSYAEFDEVLYFKDSHIIKSYSLLHLGGAYYLAQIIFVLMAFIVLNMGYNYRQDQKVNYNIRIKALGKPLNDIIFDVKGFKPAELNFLDFLPGFHKIFYLILLTFEFLFFISILIRFNKFLHYNSRLFVIIFLAPILVSLISYLFYFNKYNTRIKNV
ncbi:MAG: hypothetical protein IPH62_09675 [Ignavibacteriae bacterium]|nr:hypothetical protein [Ignavibacteriota bacterium]